MAGIGAVGQRLLRVEGFLAAYAGAPQALVDGILHLFEVGLETVVAQVFDFILAGEGHVAGRSDYLYLGGENLEGEVETHLVVAGAGRAVGNGVCAYFLGIVDNSHGLEYALGRHADRVCAVAEHVSGYHVLYGAVVVFPGDVEGGVGGGAESKGAFLYAGEFFGSEAAGVGYGRVNFVTEVFGEVFGGKRCVEAAAECEYYFFLIVHNCVRVRG